MVLAKLVWRLASPYDAYIAHVSRLNAALQRLRAVTDAVLRYEAGLHGSVRLQPGAEDPDARVQRFRERIGAAAAQMSDDQFEDFIGHLGGGASAEVEADRARTVSRMGLTASGLEDQFAVAGHALAVLERRSFDPGRPDLARQLRGNGLPLSTLGDYRHELHELGVRVGKAPA
jgi:hypothetical protein